MSGHLRDRVTMIAFSVDTLSLGRPSEFHCRISYASPKILTKLKLSDVGRFYKYNFFLTTSKQLQIILL